MTTAPLTQKEKIAAAKLKAEEMKKAAAAKRAAKEAADAAAGAGAAGAAPAVDERFLPGEQNLILVDWDDTLFPTSAWKGRIKEGATHPLRESKVAALSTAIFEFIRVLQRFGSVKIVTHGTKGWYEMSSAVLLPEAKTLLDSLPARYRDSHGKKYMTQKAVGSKYLTNIGTEVESFGEWYKTDMFFHFISETRLPQKWDETHLPDKVVLPRCVLVVGDGTAEKRSYDELGNQARLYASRPGHAAVAQVGLRGVFYKDHPSFEELLAQLAWATASVPTHLLPADDARTRMWDLTSFPAWVCMEKVGANAYSPVGHGSVLPSGAAASSAASSSGAPPTSGEGAPRAGGVEELDEEAQLQLALAASLTSQ